MRPSTFMQKIQIKTLFLIIPVFWMGDGRAEMKGLIKALETTVQKECAVFSKNKSTAECKELKVHIKNLKNEQKLLESGAPPCQSAPSPSQQYVRALSALPGRNPLEVIRLMKCFTEELKTKTTCQANDAKTVCQIGGLDVTGWFTEGCKHFFIQIPEPRMGRGAAKEYHKIYSVDWNPLAIGTYIPGAKFDAESRKREEEILRHLMKEIEANPALQKGVIRTVYLDDNAIVQDFYDGGDLYTWLKGDKKKGKPANYDEMKKSGSWLTVAQDLSHGLSNLHKMRVFHRDIKPENAVIQDGNSQKLVKAAYTDIGLSSIAPKCLNGVLTFEKRFAGSPLFLPPEILHEIPCSEETLESAMKEAQKQDVYAHAMTLYELKHGKDVPWIKCENRPGWRLYDEKCWSEKILELQASLRAAPHPDPVDMAIAAGLEFDPKKRVSSEEFLKIIETK